MKLYLENGYLDVRNILAQGYPFNIVWGGRAVGKTYGALETVVEDGVTFMLMRRTQAQLDLISKPEFSPFKTINRNNGWNVGINTISKYNGAIYHMEQQDGKNHPVGSPIGYTAALSTIANTRGFDGSDIEVLIYDEFIPEPHARPIKEEAQAFLNAYETINRNRELEGRKPLQVICLANANTLDNPLFLGLQLVTRAERMWRRGQEYSVIPSRGVLLVNVCNSEISDQKKDTALYRFAGDCEFSKMSLSNTFVGEDERGRIGTKPIKEYKPLVSIGEICIYRHKSDNLYYCSGHHTGSPPKYGVGDTERLRFKKSFSWLWGAYLDRKIDFEERICEILLTKYFS